MMKKIFPVLGLLALVMLLCSMARAETVPVSVSGKTESIVLAGGCFWGVEAVFEHTKGVVKAISGYAGGDAKRATYDQVSDGNTGHAEAVQITYDPSQISLQQLLDVYFKVAHDPTQLNYQGPDHGTQYRSEIFTTATNQDALVKGVMTELEATKLYSQPIVTKVSALKAFYPAEDYHQNYLALNPHNPYIVMHDMPKLAKLRSTYPDLYKP